ncbi:MAG: ATP-binding cassette domain-containing protein [Sulfolobales archaeon]|nr:ATP-binding cassette domain-containing protein [Sulfolobales archaeon]MCX8199021.1 ATP-binding cassette domain-containing protein [Sulfolobales archaeon]MDW8170000.1 ATP-binding cassette domain-containing protein [Desulfurococcaceae archaeon]
MKALVIAKGLKKYFPVRRTITDVMLMKGRLYVRAVDGVNLEIGFGETLALVGESGSGKTTTGRMLIGLEKPTEGSILFEGIELTKLSKRALKKIRPHMQMIFQDPYASLDPRVKVGDQVAQPLIINGLCNADEAKEKVLEVLERVGLTPPSEIYERYPHQLSGGQRQRIVIARAMIMRPKFVVADEPVSMIDVSLRASILELLKEFKREYGLSMLFITHDLAVAKLVADRVTVMYLGKIVEEGAVGEVIHSPLHPYTKALISSVPTIGNRILEKLKVVGEIPNPINIPSGCRFHTRCPFVMNKCRSDEAPWINVSKGHGVSCWLYSTK